MTMSPVEKAPPPPGPSAEAPLAPPAASRPSPGGPASAAPAAPTPEVGRTRRLVIEIVALYGCLVGLNALFAPNLWGFTGVQPPPALMVVALIAGRYGLMAGVGTAGVGCVLYELLPMLGGGPSRIPNPLDLPHSGILACLLIGSGLLGSLYDALHRELREARQKAVEAEARAGTLASKNDMLETVNRELRGKIMGETETIESLYEMAQRLTTLERGLLAPAALELVRKQAGAEECRFFQVEGAVMHLVGEHGRNRQQEPPRRAVPETGLVARALREKRLVSVRELGLEEGEGREAPDDPIVVAPLVAPQGNAVLGLITVDRLPFTRFTPQTLRVLGVIADWTARAMSNVTLFSNAEERRALEEQALGDLIERLRRHTLTQRDLDYLEALATSMSSHLMQALHSSREDMTIRSNALLVLDRIGNQLSPADVQSLRSFVERELDWLLRTYFDRVYLARQADCEALSLLGFYIHQQVRSMAMQVLTAEMIVVHLEQKVDSGLLRTALLPLLHPGEAAAAGRAVALRNLEKWSGPEFARRFGLVVNDDADGFLELNRDVLGLPLRPLQEYLVSLLGRRDRWLVCTTLHAMGQLAWSGFRNSVVKLFADPDRYVREAAIAAAAPLFGDEPPPYVRDMVAAAGQDPDAAVRAVARETAEAWRATTPA